MIGGALKGLFRVYERLRSLESSGDANEVAAGGLPLPPTELRFRVAGTPAVTPFIDGGEKAAATVRELLARAGRPIEECRAVLDFGCGCGRVLRHWNDIPEGRMHGCDLDAELVGWCDAHLDFARVSVNPAEPPTAFADQSFDAVYAFSVLTHTAGDLQRRWVEEFRRILAKDGVLIFSTHGEHYMPRLNRDERARFEGGELVVRFASAAGSNLCNAYHPESFVRRELAAGWQVVAFAPEGARGNPRQDAWVFRRV